MRNGREKRESHANERLRFLASADDRAVERAKK